MGLEDRTKRVPLKFPIPIFPAILSHISTESTRGSWGQSSYLYLPVTSIFPSERLPNVLVQYVSQGEASVWIGGNLPFAVLLFFMPFSAPLISSRSLDCQVDHWCCSGSQQLSLVYGVVKVAASYLCLPPFWADYLCALPEWSSGRGWRLRGCAQHRAEQWVLYRVIGLQGGCHPANLVPGEPFPWRQDCQGHCLFCGPDIHVSRGVHHCWSLHGIYWSHHFSRERGDYQKAQWRDQHNHD